MSYQETLRKSLVIILVGFMCLVVGFAAGRSYDLNITTANASEQILESPVPAY